VSGIGSKRVRAQERVRSPESGKSFLASWAMHAPEAGDLRRINEAVFQDLVTQRYFG
jgi:hypothetical protein